MIDMGPSERILHDAVSPDENECPPHRVLLYDPAVICLVQHSYDYAAIS
jgi:hypothetical protein